MQRDRPVKRYRACSGKDKICFFRYPAISFIQKDIKHEIFDLIGIVDESYDEGNHGMDLIQGTDRLMSILREYKKRNPSS